MCCCKAGYRQHCLQLIFTAFKSPEEQIWHHFISSVSSYEAQDTKHSYFNTNMIFAISRLQQNPAICSPQADMGCMCLGRKIFILKTLQLTLYRHNYFIWDTSALNQWRKVLSIEQITKQQSANYTQIKQSRSYIHGYIELMMPVRLEPILHCLQLKGEYAGSSINWSKGPDNAALRRKHLEWRESKVRSPLVRKSCSTCSQLNSTWAQRTDLIKHQWCSWQRCSKGGSHRNSTADPALLQWNQAVLQTGTATHTARSQPACFLSFTLTNKVSARR